MVAPTEDIAALRQTAQNALQAGKFPAALAQAEAAIAAAPDDVECLYLAGVAARYAGELSKAERHINALKSLQPEFGRAWQEDGHRLRDQGQLDAALLAYGRACQYNPALDASWRAQADILDRQGKTPAARAARDQADRIKALPRHLIAVTHHLSEGRLLKAEDLCRAFLQKHPRNTEAMRLLAEIGSRLGVLDDADLLLQAATEIDPDTIQLRLDYIAVLRKRQKYADALKQAELLHARDPQNPLFASHLAIERMQTGDYASALTLFDDVLSTLPDDPATLTSKGHALKTAGNQDDAITAYKTAIANQPEHGDAWYALANLKTYSFSEGELLSMRSIEERPHLSHMSRVHLCFALAKAHEDREAYSKAFEYYARGNALKSAQTRYTTEQMRAEFAAQTDACTSALFAGRAGTGHTASDPIFIVGLPRAGSTLIEQILASHSQVDGTLELPNILSLAHRLRGRNRANVKEAYPYNLSDLPAEQLAQLGQDYIDSTQIHRKGAAFFTDKMPNNFRHIGLIHLMLPNAKIIDARRDPMDCCWSCFKQLFAEGQEFTYGLPDIGNYYKAYTELMDHWDSVLPEGRILRVQHEDVLDDLDGQVRRLLDYCGLPFEEACLNFHETDRAVRTASSEQVRQPINRSGQGQWRPYDAHLAPLKLILGK